MQPSQVAPELGSSPEDGQEDVKPISESSPESSTDVKGVEQNKPTMLDAVRKALADGSENSPKSDLTPETKTGTEATKTGEDSQTLKEEFSLEEMRQFPAKTQSRIRQLRANGKAAEDQVKELQPKAENFDRITNMMQQNQLSQQEVDDGFEIMGLMKMKPEKALEKLAPMVRKLLAATGHQLPDDLKAEVESGALTEARARELSVARSTATHLSARVEQDAEQRKQEDESKRVRELTDTVTKTADAWHAEKAKTDPDWHLKQARVGELVELQIRRTGIFPQSDKEARTMFDEILKTVNAEMKNFIPRKQPITPQNGNASHGAKAEPTSMREAMEQAVQK